MMRATSNQGVRWSAGPMRSNEMPSNAAIDPAWFSPTTRRRRFWPSSFRSKGRTSVANHRTPSAFGRIFIMDGPEEHDLTALLECAAGRLRLQLMTKKIDRLDAVIAE